MSLSGWSFDKHFRSAQQNAADAAQFPAIIEARLLLSRCEIGEHKFFSYAANHREALMWWTSQEAVITNHFSQVLFRLLSTIENVHVRSILAPVVVGEHSALREGIAYGSHPHLLSKLVVDIGIDPNSVVPLPMTVAFANALEGCVKEIPYALGFLGVGNEAMLVPEYTAIEAAFSRHYPRDVYRPFLRANIEEDINHKNLMEIAAANCINNPHESELYINGARDGINARIKYYNDLYDYVVRK
jgi:hypothetical protein